MDLFEGQPQGAPEYAVIKVDDIGHLFAGQSQTELGVGNRLLLSDDSLHANARLVQARNDIDVVDPRAPLEAWELFDVPADSARLCPHFSIEMETGTGKTYVYLRTIFELSRRFGFLKFVIVVPSVAIREGVLKNMEITAEHFRALYNNLTCQHFVYEASRINQIREFATGNALQILIMNIDAFRKNFVGTEDQQKSNVIYKESDKLSGRQPIEFVQAARPIVIIDEPQSVDSTPRAQEAIKALNPLCTLRYSATHRHPYNLVYRLDPIRAFELKLVKQIVVASAAAVGGANDAFVRVEKIDNRGGIKAKLRIDVQSPGGPKAKSVTVKHGADLHAVSNERTAYRDGFSVAEISAEPGNEFVRFSNGLRLGPGEESGGMREDVWRAQIKETAKRHLEKELQLQGRGIKVLSLFFIDRVANYRGYDEAGHAAPGKFAVATEEALTEFGRDPRYASLDSMKMPRERLHDGYFAQDRNKVLKDTRGDTQADDAVYDLIMKDKERLLALDEPLRFIFSHSALREGWDNPNIFQICTLNETASAVKKRQEIGRGLRLPVDQNGLRVRDDAVNRLYVMANESYEDFARALQTEYEEDCGVTFGKVPITAIAKLARVVDGQEQPIGLGVAEEIRASLVTESILDAGGRILPAFQPQRPDFRLSLPEQHADLAPAVTDLLATYQIERHVRRDRDERPNRLRKEILLGPEFQALWDRIKAKTTYRVEFETSELVHRAAEAVKRMPTITPPTVRISAGRLSLQKGGVTTTATSVAEEETSYGNRPLPDVLAYLQSEAELTRSTLVRILRESGRLAEFFVDPQRFMDAVAANVKHELERLLVEGVKYERIEGTGGEAEWEMRLFEEHDGDVINFLDAQSVKHSVYEYVVCESEVEREFAKQLDAREDIKVFAKLPSWFEIDTPVGKYNPDWAIVKDDGRVLYLVRETKGTKDFMKLRTSEADKVRSGERHFDALGVPFAVAVTAAEV